MINLSNHTNKIRHMLFSSGSPERPSTNRIFNLDYLSRPYTKGRSNASIPTLYFHTPTSVHCHLHLAGPTQQLPPLICHIDSNSSPQLQVELVQ